MSESIEEDEEVKIIADKGKGIKYFKWNEALETILLEQLLADDIINAQHGSKQTKLKNMRETLENNATFKQVMTVQNVHLPKDASMMRHAEDIADRIVKYKGLSLTSLLDMDLADTMDEYTDLEYHAICFKQALLRKEHQSLEPKKKKKKKTNEDYQVPEEVVTKAFTTSSNNMGASSSSSAVVEKVVDLVTQEPQPSVTKPISTGTEEELLQKKREDTMFDMVNYLMSENKELKEELKQLKEENKKYKEQTRKRRLNEDAAETTFMSM